MTIEAIDARWRFPPEGDVTHVVSFQSFDLHTRKVETFAVLFTGRFPRNLGSDLSSRAGFNKRSARENSENIDYFFNHLIERGDIESKRRERHDFD